MVDKIIDENIFTTDWKCPEIVNRVAEIKKIHEYIIESFLKEKGMPRATFIYGGTGSGKTFVVDKTITDSLPEIKKHAPFVEYVYINLRTEGTPSYYTVLSLIANQLKKYLPAGEITEISDNLGRQTLLTVLKQVIKQKKICVLLVIDEAERIYHYEKNNDFFYSMAYMYTDFKDSGIFVGLCPIFITNNVQLFQKFDKATQERIPYLIHFQPYTQKDIELILRTILKYALGSVDLTIYNHCISVISEYVDNCSKSAREAKMTMLNFLKTGDVQTAIASSERNVIQDEISGLSLHQLLFLKAVALSNPPNIGHVYHRYGAICNALGESPQSYKTITRLSEHLEKDGLLSREKKSFGRARGITTVLYPGVTADIMLPLVEQAVKTRLGGA